MNRLVEIASSPSPPWILLVNKSEIYNKYNMPGWVFKDENTSFEIRILRASKFKSADSIFNEFAASWQFAQFIDGFGENWNALIDCMQLLDDLFDCDHYIQIINDPDNLFRLERNKELKFLLNNLNLFGEYWAATNTEFPPDHVNPKGFHTFLVCENKKHMKELHDYCQEVCDWEIGILV